MAEWLRRLTRNQMGSSRVGSNPTRSEKNYFLHCLVFASVRSLLLVGETFESCDGRVVKAFDSKSNGIFPRRFESYSQRLPFEKFRQYLKVFPVCRAHHKDVSKHQKLCATSKLSFSPTRMLSECSNCMFVFTVGQFKLLA